MNAKSYRPNDVRKGNIRPKAVKNVIFAAKVLRISSGYLAYYYMIFYRFHHVARLACVHEKPIQQMKT